MTVLFIFNRSITEMLLIQIATVDSKTKIAVKKLKDKRCAGHSTPAQVADYDTLKRMIKK